MTEMENGGNCWFLHWGEDRDQSSGDRSPGRPILSPEWQVHANQPAMSPPTPIEMSTWVQEWRNALKLMLRGRQAKSEISFKCHLLWASLSLKTQFKNGPLTHTLCRYHVTLSIFLMTLNAISEYLDYYMFIISTPPIFIIKKKINLK